MNDVDMGVWVGDFFVRLGNRVKKRPRSRWFIHANRPDGSALDALLSGHHLLLLGIRGLQSSVAGLEPQLGALQFDEGGVVVGLGTEDLVAHGGLLRCNERQERQGARERLWRSDGLIDRGERRRGDSDGLINRGEGRRGDNGRLRGDSSRLGRRRGVQFGPPFRFRPHVPLLDQVFAVAVEEHALVHLLHAVVRLGDSSFLLDQADSLPDGDERFRLKPHALVRLPARREWKHAVVEACEVQHDETLDAEEIGVVRFVGPCDLDDALAITDEQMHVDALGLEADGTSVPRLIPREGADPGVFDDLYFHLLVLLRPESRSFPHWRPVRPELPVLAAFVGLLKRWFHFPLRWLGRVVFI